MPPRTTLKYHVIMLCSMVGDFAQAFILTLYFKVMAIMFGDRNEPIPEPSVFRPGR